LANASIACAGLSDEKQKAGQLTRCGIYYLVAASFAEEDNLESAEWYKAKGFKVLTVAQQYSDSDTVKANIETQMIEVLNDSGSIEPDWQVACDALVEKYSRDGKSD